VSKEVQHAHLLNAVAAFVLDRRVDDRARGDVERLARGDDLAEVLGDDLAVDVDAERLGEGEVRERGPLAAVGLVLDVALDGHHLLDRLLAEAGPNATVRAVEALPGVPADLGLGGEALVGVVERRRLDDGAVEERVGLVDDEQRLDDLGAGRLACERDLGRVGAVRAEVGLDELCVRRPSQPGTETVATRGSRPEAGGREHALRACMTSVKP